MTESSHLILVACFAQLQQEFWSNPHGEAARSHAARFTQDLRIPSPMIYRICKAFEVESGHLLSKHPGRCRFPHGHSRRIEVVLASESLDEHDMVVDFKALKLAISDFLDSFDHAMAVNSQDPRLAEIQSTSDRVLVFKDEDPTTEAMAKRIYEYLEEQLTTGGTYTDEHANTFALRTGVTLERVRVGETSSSWAEYGI